MNFRDPGYQWKAQKWPISCNAVSPVMTCVPPYIHILRESLLSLLGTVELLGISVAVNLLQTSEGSSLHSMSMDKDFATRVTQPLTSYMGFITHL